MRNRFILVAHAGDGFLDMLTEELAATDYALLHAKDGEEAIQCLELLKSEIDLAIIQLELPFMSGLHVIWRLVKRKQPKPTRIIATTAVDVPLLKHVMKELGVEVVVQVVQTPIPEQDWRKTIGTVLSREPIGLTTDEIAFLEQRCNQIESVLHSFGAAAQD